MASLTDSSESPTDTTTSSDVSVAVSSKTSDKPAVSNQAADPDFVTATPKLTFTDTDKTDAQATSLDKADSDDTASSSVLDTPFTSALQPVDAMMVGAIDKASPLDRTTPAEP